MNLQGNWNAGILEGRNDGRAGRRPEYWNDGRLENWKAEEPKAGMKHFIGIGSCLPKRLLFAFFVRT